MLCTPFLSSAMKQAPPPSLSPSKFCLEPPQDPLLLIHFPGLFPLTDTQPLFFFHKMDMPPSLETPPSPPQVPFPADPCPRHQRGNSAPASFTTIARYNWYALHVKAREAKQDVDLQGVWRLYNCQIPPKDEMMGPRGENERLREENRRIGG